MTMTDAPLAAVVPVARPFCADWLIPDWDAPAAVRACVTTRQRPTAGTLAATHADDDSPYAQFNLAMHVGDAPHKVAANRSLLRQTQIVQPGSAASLILPGEPFWLNQVHGTLVLDAAAGARSDGPCSPQPQPPPDADGSFTRLPGQVCAVLTADCLPLLLCADDGSVVAAVHAGWRGLADGVIESAVTAMGIAPARLLAWLGPAIGPGAFEVGVDVRDAFCVHDPQAARAFVVQGEGADKERKWFCDLYRLARQRLVTQGVVRITGGACCTYSDKQRFYSFRRDGVTGRMAALIWLEPGA